MGKKEFVVRRVIQLVVLYFVIGATLWVLFRLSPANPMSNFIGPSFTAEMEAEIRQAFGLNDPWYIQLGKFLIQIATFNFGFSFVSMESVTKLIAGKVVNTLLLMGTAIILAYVIALPFGAYMAWNRGSGREQAGIVLSLTSRSAPVFWTGILAIWLLGLKFGIAPPGGMTSPGATYPTKIALVTSLDFWQHLWLPALVQAFYFMSLPALLMRSSMLEILNEDFVEFAELKGLDDRTVMLKHAARNAILPVVTAFAIGAAYAVGSSVVIETVFAWPGLGHAMVQSVLRADYPMAQGTFLTLAIFVITANFLADLAYGYLDPRITYD